MRTRQELGRHLCLIVLYPGSVDEGNAMQNSLYRSLGLMLTVSGRTVNQLGSSEGLSNSARHCGRCCA